LAPGDGGAQTGPDLEPAAARPPTPEPVNAPAIFFRALRAAILRFFRRLFGGSR
jgi:hypothetical protein